MLWREVLTMDPLRRLLLVLLVYITSPIECSHVAWPLDCTETVTVSEDFQAVFVPPGTVCFQCDFGNGPATDTTFQIDSTAVAEGSGVGSTVNGVLVIYDAERVFETQASRDVKCSSRGVGGKAFNTVTVLKKGEMQERETVKRQSAPGAPENLMVAERTNVSLLITWNNPASDGGTPINRIRLRLTNQKTSITGTPIIVDAPSTNEYNITGLGPLTNYAISLSLINEGGSRGAEAIIVAATLSQSLDIINNPIISRSSTSISLRWRPPVRNPDTTDPVEYYELTYGEIGGDTMTMTLPPMFEASGSFPVRVTITDLMRATSYAITVVAFNSRGPGATYRPPDIMTVIEFPTAPRNFMAMALSPFSLELTWTVPEDDGGVQIEKYIIQRVIGGSLLPDIELDGNARRYVIMNLQPDTAYEVTLTADNGDKESPPVMQQGTTPPLMTPQIPAPPTFSVISDTTATVSWIAPDGFPDTYTVMYSDGENQPMEITRDSTALSAVLMGLQPLTQYTVRVRAGNTAGDSDFSAGTTFSTFGDIVIQASPQTTVTAGAVGQVVLQCSLQTLQAGETINYQWSRDGGLPAGSQTSGDTLTFNNPQPEVSGEYTCTAQQVTESIQLTVEIGVPGQVGDIQVDVDDESIDLQWVAPRNNGGAITAYIVRILLSGGEEYSNMFQTTSATVSRDDFQGADDPNRSIDIDYQVRVAAINVAGTGEEGSENFLFLAESAAPPESAVSLALLSGLLVLSLSFIIGY